jgi:hypothetical protein
MLHLEREFAKCSIVKKGKLKFNYSNRGANSKRFLIYVLCSLRILKMNKLLKLKSKY